MALKIISDPGCLGLIREHSLKERFSLFGYPDGVYSLLPNRFFRNWLDEEPTVGECSLGKGSGFGVGSWVKYDAGEQNLRIGRFVSGGLNLRFLLNGQHEMRTISTCVFGGFGNGLSSAPLPQYSDTVVRNDVWIGDETMILGGSTIENGCVIGARSLVPPNFRSEPYGVYGGSPVRLIRLRFAEKVCEALQELQWWEMPTSWIRANNSFFLIDMSFDEGMSLEAIAELRRRKLGAS
jgi:virginiamycin A acetyltransferase